MKDLVRLKTSLNEEMEQILNDQIKIEGNSSAKYLAMASWCAEKGFEHATSFFMTQADEERTHMLKIFNYIIERGGKAVSPEVSNVRHEYDSLREVCETALEQEISVSNSINRVVEAARKTNDYATDNFMQWFVSEQIEEEAIARRIVELFDIIGEDGVGLFTIDKEIGKVRGAYEAGA